MKYTPKGKKLVADAHPMTGKTCPVLSVKITKGPDQVMIEALASRGRKLGGAIILRRYGRKPDDYVVVESVNVDDKLQRCGLGTRLYEMAAAEACKAELPLRSDVFRSQCSQGFWEKQVKKDRARCLAPAPESSRASAAATSSHPCGLPVQGRGGCKQYELETCSKDLTGIGKRRRRRGR